MARRTSSLRRNDFQRGFRALEHMANEVGEANALPVTEAAKALVKGIKSVLSVKGGTSEPGEPPRKRSGKLHKSIGTEIVAGTRRVGSGHYTSSIQQFGMISQAHGDRPAAGLRKARKAVKARVIEPRPFMEPGLEVAKPEMTQALVSALRKKDIRGLING